ncbi:MAG: nucleotidyltransferase family protein [Verrucomicrobia bacterium]|nr:nucleotidyltransferase family protein [Verrucomicrobiota bacterium]
MWGIIPAAGEGKRIQPLAFSKELLPVGAVSAPSRIAPRAVSDFIVERMAYGGVHTISFVISPYKTDILRYHGAGRRNVSYVYHVQAVPKGLCDAVFCPAPLIPESETVLIGLPDTVWFPADGYRKLPAGTLSFLLFPVKSPWNFDVVNTGARDEVQNIQVKDPQASNPWVWGAIKMAGHVYHALHRLWHERQYQDEYLGTLVNEWLARGGKAVGIRAGTQYLDVGTIEGFHEACGLLGANHQGVAVAPAADTGAGPGAELMGDNAPACELRF